MRYYLRRLIGIALEPHLTLTSNTHEADDIEAAIELTYKQGWTDGLPVVPPTKRAIERHLDYLGREPEEVLGIVPPKAGIATMEKVVINCVMAGCLPEYDPIVLAALAAVMEDKFNLNGVQTTTHPCAPLIIVSGPAVKALGFNTRENALGHGSRANATIGRALRLILWNIGGGYPGEPCKTCHGQPGYNSFCIAEDSETNPWEPLHVTRGFNAEDTVVTVTAVEAPRSMSTGAKQSPADDVLEIIADGIRTVGSNTIYGGDTVVVLAPVVAGNIAAGGYSKADAVRELMRRSVRKVSDVTRHKSVPEHMPLHWSHLVEPNNPDALVPLLRKPENVILVTTGGIGGAFCSIAPSWGEPWGGQTQSKKVQFLKH
jgi:hypothetical protein